MRSLLFFNPRSGGGSISVDALRSEATRRGIDVHVLRPEDDLAELARSARADVLGMAGGDGSLSAVANAAIEQDVPFVCVPTGTRNHFANDAGLPTDEPLRALDAFVDGSERRVDVGRADGRLFLNNVSLGLYARLVHQREHRRQQGQLFARLRALASSLRDGAWSQRFVVDGLPIRASVVLVANNEYTLDVRMLGRRERLDAGSLAVYSARGLRRLRWAERSARDVRVQTRRRSLRAAVDGEPERFASPVRLWIEPGALRLLVPSDPRTESP